VSASDGVTIDTTPPEVTFTFQNKPVTSQEVVYQTAADQLEILWRVDDASGLNRTVLLNDVFDHDAAFRLVEASPTDLLAFPDPSPLSGDSRSFGLRVTDGAGNAAMYRLPHLTLDITAPVFLDLRCSPAVSTLAPLVACDWETVDEAHSALAAVRVGLGSGPAKTDLLNFTTLSPQSRAWSHDAWEILSRLQEQESAQLYVIFEASNTAGNMTTTPVLVVNDLTPPEVDDVIVVTSPRPGHHDDKQQCQTIEDFIEVLITGIEDRETEIKRWVELVAFFSCIHFNNWLILALGVLINV
jgi:hypothetical protein